MPSNASANLRPNQIKARAQRPRNPQIGRQVQRTLGDTVEKLKLRTPTIELTILVETCGDHPINPLVENGLRDGGGLS